MNDPLTDSNPADSEVVDEKEKDVIEKENLEETKNKTSEIIESDTTTSEMAESKPTETLETPTIEVPVVSRPKQESIEYNNDTFLLPGNSIDLKLRNELNLVNLDMQGTTLLDKPRVSKEALIKAILTSTGTINTIVGEVGESRHHIIEIEKSQDTLERALIVMGKRMTDAEAGQVELKIKLERQAQLMLDLEENMKNQFIQMKEKMEAVQVVFEKKLTEQHDAHVALINKVKEEHQAAEKAMKSDISALKSSRDIMVRVIEELKEKIAKNDIANAKFDASQVIFSESKKALPEVIADINKVQKEHKESISGHDALLIDMKTNIARLPSKDDLLKMEEAAKTREKEMQSFMEDGGENENLRGSPTPSSPTSRKSTMGKGGGGGGGGGGMSAEVQNSIKLMNDRLTDMQNAVAHIDRGLGHKIDSNKVEERLDAKYDEIVKYLQSAISSAAQEEDEFKRLACELQDLVKTLMATKADRIELSQMAEKLSLGGTLLDQIENIKLILDMKVNKGDIDDVLLEKVDKEDLSKGMKALQNSISTTMKTLVEQLKEPTSTPWLATSPKTTDGSPSNSILCLSCNKKRSEGCHDHDKLPVSSKQGPGGQTMGGGFQVKFVANSPTNKSGKLPKIDGGVSTELNTSSIRREKAANRGLLIAEDGHVYAGANPSNAYPPIIHSPTKKDVGNNNFRPSSSEERNEVM